MKNLIKKLLITGALITIPLIAYSAPSVMTIPQGGTNTSTKPTADQILIGNGSLGYALKTILAGTGASIATTSNTITISATGSGSASSSGSDTWVQYNNAGAFGASADFTYNSTSKALSIPYINATSATATDIYLTTPLADTWTNFFNAYKDPTGFYSRDTSAISYATGTYTFSIAPATSTFDVYIKGKKYTKSGADSIVVGSTAGSSVIVYYDMNGTIATTTPASFDFCNKGAIISYVYNTNTDGVYSDERHGANMPCSVHHYLHDTVGVRYSSGLTATLNNTTQSYTAGVIFDEDIEFDLPAVTTSTNWYKDGAAYHVFRINRTTPYETFGGTILYNNGNATATVSSGSYVNYYVYATNNQAYGIWSVMGQAQFANVSLARAEQPSALSLSTLPSMELKLLYKVTYRNVAGTPTYVEATDFRTQQAIGSTFTPTDHATLTNLACLLSGHTDIFCLSANNTVTGATTFSATTTMATTTIASSTITFANAGSLNVSGIITSSGNNVFSGTQSFTATSSFATTTQASSTISFLNSVMMYFTNASSTGGATIPTLYSTDGKITNITSTGITATDIYATTYKSGAWNGTAIGDAYLTKSGDWTGTIDGNNFAGGAVAQGDMLYGSAAGTLSELAKDANATRYISNTGSSNNPAWAQVNLANGVTGVLPKANGGTATSDNPTTDQFLVGNASGGYDFRAIVAGANTTITTSTPNQIIIASTASGGGSATTSIKTDYEWYASSSASVLASTTAMEIDMTTDSAATTSCYSLLDRPIKWEKSDGTDKIGFVRDAYSSSTNARYCVIHIGGSTVESGDKNVQISKNRTIKTFHWYIAGEQIQDASNPIGNQWLVPFRQNIKVLSCDAQVSDGADTDLQFNVYDDGTNIFSSAVAFSTGVSKYDQTPTTMDVAGGSRMTLRTTVSTGTDKADDLIVDCYYIPASIVTSTQPY